MTVSAAVKFKPNPPALVESNIINFFNEGLQNLHKINSIIKFNESITFLQIPFDH